MTAIGPISDSHREINVVEPVSPALERVKQMLFRPFDLGKWFAIGFCAWLAQLGESGGFNFHTSTSNQNHSTDSFRHFYDQAREFTLNNLYWIIPAAIALILLCVALGLLILWLNSRGKFMFLHCVALDKAEVSEPWNKFAAEANSLFWFRVVVQLIGAVVTLPMLVIIAVLVVKMVLAGEPDAGAIMICAGLGLMFVLLAIVFALINKFTADFVVPIMFLRGGKCLAAWKEFGGLLTANAGQFTLYILFSIVLSIAIVVIVIGAVILTCCIAGCIMAIPYIGTVLLLPVLVFKRAYSLYFFRQFGTAYDVFPPTSPAASPPTGLQPLAPTPPPA